MKVHNSLTIAIKDYFKGLIEQGKQEVDILEANAEICKIIDGMEGRLIELPCKVGDTLYDIHNEKVFGGKVIMVNMFEDCFTFAASGGRYFKDDEIGKTVFLTKEAEQALKGGGEG